MCSIAPIKFLLHTEFRDKKLQRGSKEDGVMLRKGLANSDVEVVVIVYIRCSSLDHPPSGGMKKLLHDNRPESDRSYA